MNCYVCGGEKHPQTWYNDMCKQHRSEYVKEKMRLYADRKKEQIRMYGHNPCATKPHEYFSLNQWKERCKNCGITIASRKLKREPYRLGVAQEIGSAKYLKILRCYHMTAKIRFHPVSEDAKVANILYTLRYDKGMDADTIVRIAHMPHSVLNKYLLRFPWYPKMGTTGM